MAPFGCRHALRTWQRRDGNPSVRPASAGVVWAPASPAATSTAAIVAPRTRCFIGRPPSGSNADRPTHAGAGPASEYRPAAQAALPGKFRRAETMKNGQGTKSWVGAASRAAPGGRGPARLAGPTPAPSQLRRLGFRLEQRRVAVVHL